MAKAEVGESRSFIAPPRMFGKKRLSNDGKLGFSQRFAQPRRSQKPQPNTTNMRGSVVGNTSRNPHEVEFVGSNPTPASKDARSNSPLCSQCGSAKTWKDGIRDTDLGPVQRWICRNCGYRFSDPQRVLNGLRMSEHVERISTKKLKSRPNIHSNCQICVLEKEAKNLAKVETRIEKPLRDGTTQTVDVKGLIIQFMAWCEAQGYPQGNKYHHYLKRLVRLGANLLDPESVKQTIGKHKCKNGTKMLFVYAYDAFNRMLKVTWEPPKYKQEETLPFVPEESELDQLIAACRGKRMAAFLQCLKETYADPGEVLGLRWIDISDNIITINKPVKGHLPGQIQVSNKVLAMLNSLPKTSERIFPARYDNMWKCFSQVRKRAAALQQNPRLLAIAFRSFRHWGGSMIAHYTNGNVLTVKKLLRHKRIENTMKYISMIHFKDDEFEVTTATTIEEAKQILGSGFDYVTQKDGIMLFRRPKRFR